MEEVVSENKKPIDIEGQNAKNLKIKDLLKLSVRAFKVRPARTFLTILGMSVGIGTVFFLISLGYGLQYILLGRLAPTEDSLISLQASYPQEGSLAISKSTIDDVSKMEQVAEISPVGQYTGEVHYEEFNGDLIIKVIDDKYSRLSGFVANFSKKDAQFGEGAIISTAGLKLLGLPEDETSLGRIITATAPYEIPALKPSDPPIIKTNSTKNPIAITGIVKDNLSPYIFVPITQMQEAPNAYDMFYVKAKDDPSLEPLRRSLIDKGFIISARVDTVRQAKKITGIITMVLGVFGATALVVSSIGMFNTMLISFMERIFEVGIMKSIGATKRDILGLFLMESFVMGLMGGLGGIILGFGAGTLVNLGMGFLAHALGGKSVNLFIYPARFMVFIIVLSGTVGLLSGYWPARRAAKLSAREAFLRK